MIRFLYLFGIVFCTFLIGCDQATLMRKFTPPEDATVARDYVDLLIQGKFEQIENGLDPSIVDSGIRGTLAKMSAMFPTERAKSIKVVGANIFHGAEYSETNITLEYEFPSKWLLASVVIRKKGVSPTITGLHVEPLSDSLEHINSFTLKDKSVLQYLVLLMAIVLPLFTIYVLVLCVRTRPLKRKWLWIIFVLVGLVQFSVNWTTGEWHVTPLAFRIPCGFAGHPLYGPWTVAAYLPLGAILFLRERKKKFGYSVEPSAPPGPANPTPDHRLIGN